MLLILVLYPQNLPLMCWVRATFFSSRHRDVQHLLNLCTTAPFFRLKFSRHRNSATAAPRHLILEPPRHILGEKILAIKKCVTEPYI